MSQPILYIPRRASIGLPSNLAKLVSTPGVCFECSLRSHADQVRHFSSSKSKNASAQADPSATNMAMMKKSAAKQPSMMAKMAKMSKQEVGTDIGRIPGSIILPAWKDYPKGIKAILRLHWKKFVDTLTGTASIFYATKWDVPRDRKTGKKLRHPTHLNQRLSIARDYHILLNHSLTQKNPRILEPFTSSGLYAQCKRQMDAREASQETVGWALIAYQGIKYPTFLEKWPLNFFLPFAATRVVSDRMMTIPFREYSYVRECIVRIRSTQTIVKETVVKGKDHAKTKTLTEYVVLQKFVLQGEEQPWRIWGTIDPTKEELEQAINGKNKRKLNLAANFKEKMSSVTGMNF